MVGGEKTCCVEYTSARSFNLRYELLNQSITSQLDDHLPMYCGVLYQISDLIQALLPTYQGHVLMHDGKLLLTVGGAFWIFIFSLCIAINLNTHRSRKVI